MPPTRILFVCGRNSARSQMAETLANRFHPDRLEAESAGLDPGPLLPEAVAAMAELGLNISGNRSKSAFEFFKQGRMYDLVITVCDQETDTRCPIFPGIRKRLNWPLPDPAAPPTPEARLAAARAVRDELRQRLDRLAAESA